MTWLLKRVLTRTATDHEGHVTVGVAGSGLRASFPTAWRYGTGVYEPETYEAIGELLEPGGFMIDVGANVGLFTLLAASKVGPEGTVWAYEASPDNARLLQANVERNGLHQVTVHHAAAGDQTGEAALFLRRGTANHSLDQGPWQDLLVGEVVVPVVRLDEVIADRFPDLIKIDVEGTEPDVLSGLSAMFDAGARPVLVIEYCPSAMEASGHDGLRLLEDLEALGYGLGLLDWDGASRPAGPVRQWLASDPPAKKVNLLCRPPA